MAFADPQSITINAVPYTLPRVGMANASTSNADSGRFAAGDNQEVVLTITQQDNRRRRQAIRVQRTKVAPDALNPTTNNNVSMSVTLVVDSPGTAFMGGFTNAEKKQLVDALVAYLTASSGAQVTKLLNGEV